jgi:hypothetical protein
MTWKENMRRSMETLGAMWRQGLHELGAALYGPGTAAQPPEYGMPGTKTPGEVAEGRRSVEIDIHEMPRRSLDDRVKQAEAQREPESPRRDAREMEKD